MTETEIKFYHNAPDRLRAACSITAKAVRQARRVLVFAPDDMVARRFDSLLWSAQPQSFVPHVSASSPLASRTPVVISRTLANCPHTDVLINLNSELPGDFTQFKLLVEIVPQEDAERKAARQRWQFYKESGYPIVAYDLAKLADS